MTAVLTSSLLRARQGYLTALQEIPGLNSQVHGGEFDLDELKQYGLKAPCAVLSLLGFDVINMSGGTPEGNAHWGCVVLTKDKPGQVRGDSAIQLGEVVASQLMLAWAPGGGGSQRPMGMQARNLFGRKLDNTGIAMWSLEWNQKMDLISFDESEDPADDLLRFSAVWDLSPRDNDAPLGQIPDAHDLIDLEGRPHE
jgi:hypothetical protein